MFDLQLKNNIFYSVYMVYLWLHVALENGKVMYKTCHLYNKNIELKCLIL